MDLCRPRLGPQPSKVSMESCRLCGLVPVFPLMWLLSPSVFGIEMRRSNDLEMQTTKKRTNLRHNHHAAIQQYAKNAAADVYYIPELLDRFKLFAVQQQALTDHRHLYEVQRLNAAITATSNLGDKELLNETVHANLESRLEAQNAYLQMLNFVNTLKAVATGSDTSARTCNEITCGDYAICEEDEHGAKCRCEEGFDGDGFQCFPPHHFTAVSLFTLEGGKKPNVKELHLTVFNDVHLGVVFRDANEGNRGFVMVGRAGLALVRWSTPVPFSGKAKAYGPVIAGLGERSLLIGYRDADEGGSGFVVSGVLNVTDQYKILLSTPELFAKNQAHTFSIVQLPHNRAALMYAESVVDDGGNVLEAFGSACLAEVGLPANHSLAPPPPSVMGKYRFSDVPVEHLSATLLTDSTFVVAYRGITDGPGGPQPPFKEASVVWGRVLKDGEVTFSPNPVSLEPETSQIWDRGVAVVSQNMFAYSYYCGISQELKMTVIKIDPNTHQMSITDGPKILSKGKSGYVGAINVPFAPEIPHTYTFFDRPGEGVGTAQVCRVSQLGRITECKQRPFAGYDIPGGAISGQLLWDGRLIFAFATKTGEPFYQVEALFAGHAPDKAHISPPPVPSA